MENEETSKLKNFKELLDSGHIWPCEYLFKFIVKRDSVEQVKTLFAEGQMTFRESSQGNYVGLSILLHMNSSDEVLSIYTKAAKISGLIAL